MTIRIDNKVAELPADLSFEYVEENRFFTDADGYSLEIELPLAGSEANRDIFGLIELTTLDSERRWPMTLECGAINRQGIAVLTGLGDGTVRLQFLSGRSQSNFEARMESTSLRDIGGDFYTETLPEPTSVLRSYDSQRASNNYYDINIEGVALPWINQATGALQNNIIIQPLSSPQWDETVRETGLSFMPYLISVARHAAIKAGYNYDFSEWEASPLRNLIICNVLPVGLRLQRHYQPKDALPDWSILEFFRNIEPVLGGQFDIDHQMQRITFHDTATTLERIDPVELTEVDDDFEIDSTFGREESEDKYIRSRKYRFASPEVQDWSFYDCPWVERTVEDRLKHRFDTLDETVLAMQAGDSEANMYAVYLSSELNAGFCFDRRGDEEAAIRRTFNLFGPAETENNDNFEELKVLPVMMSGNVPILNTGDSYDFISKIIDGTYIPDRADDNAVAAEYLCNKIADGEPTQKEALFSHLFLAYWPGWNNRLALYPLMPSVAGFRFDSSPYGPSKVYKEPWSMRLNDGRGWPYGYLPKIDESVKYTYYFYADRLPDVRAVFHIRSKRYICGKLSAEITADGASRRIKGEFYPIVD